MRACGYTRSKDIVTSSNWWQNFDEKIEMCDSKWDHSKWPTWQVQKIQKEYKKPTKHPHPQPEREHPVIEVSLKSPWGANPPGKTSQLTAEPEEWPKRWRNSEVCIFCMCDLANPILAYTDAWCLRSLLYRLCGFCGYLVMFDPYLIYFRCYSDNTMYFS